MMMNGVTAMKNWINKNFLELLGGFTTVTSIYLFFFDGLPFAFPWGILTGAIAFLCFKTIREKRND